MAVAAPNLLIVDDDVDFAAATADLARAHGFTPHLAHSLEQSRRFAKLPSLDLMLLDLSLPDGNGLDLLDELDLPSHGQIAVVTGHPSVESAARAVSLPIIEYLIKPILPAQFDALLNQAKSRARTLAEPVSGRNGIVGECAAMRRVLDDIERIAPSPVSVLLTGESGTGKELVARALHRESGRSGPFIAVNCGAIAPELLASHLFGHERGSFTGAAGRHVGYFEQAHQGTLLLDEIAEMPAALQVYLLRVLETGTVTRVGGTDEVPVDVRIVAATNRDPLQAIADGSLREDLYYRLSDFSIELPPLRHRGNDVNLLARCFLNRLNERYATQKQFASGTDRILEQHPWPGNVRELRSAVQRAFLIGREQDEVCVIPGVRRLAAVQHDPTQVVFSVGMSYADVEREMLLKTLSHFGNDRTRTARALGVSVRTIHNQINRLRAAGESQL